MRNGFFKGHGLGNDYIVMDPTELDFKLTPKNIVKSCDRNWGIGSDGILTLEKSKKADLGAQGAATAHAEEPEEPREDPKARAAREAREDAAAAKDSIDCTSSLMYIFPTSRLASLRWSRCSWDKVATVITNARGSRSAMKVAPVATRARAPSSASVR